MLPALGSGAAGFAGISDGREYTPQRFILEVLPLLTSLDDIPGLALRSTSNLSSALSRPGIVD